MLVELGHEVSGLSLDPLPGGIFDLAGVARFLKNDLRVDIRHPEELKLAVESTNPDFAIHLAAQPLVRQSYLDPETTFQTNVNGTLNFLKALQIGSPQSGAIVVTTDKVYKNVGQIEGYVESDQLGGADPYSASKAMADILTQSWRASFETSPISIARAGNVIGGGDVSKDRLVPDLVASARTGSPVSIRNLDSVRPWQHVLDCLNGYLRLAEQMTLLGNHDDYNFGPDPESFRTVGDVVNVFGEAWGAPLKIQNFDGDQPHEANLLTLNSDKAKKVLEWSNKLDFETAIAWTSDWERRVHQGEDPLTVTQAQIREFISL